MSPRSFWPQNKWSQPQWMMPTLFLLTFRGTAKHQCPTERDPPMEGPQARHIGQTSLEWHKDEAPSMAISAAYTAQSQSTATDQHEPSWITQVTEKEKQISQYCPHATSSCSLKRCLHFLDKYSKIDICKSLSTPRTRKGGFPQTSTKMLTSYWTG